MIQDLKDALAEWNGKATDPIAAIHKEFSQQAGFVDDLLTLTTETALQRGTTWLLKRHLETGKTLTAGQIRKYYALAPDLDHWEAKLHLLQCLPFMPVGTAEKDGVADFLRRCLKSDMKFVRAWAYGGFMELAAQHPEFEPETGRHIGHARAEEAASVKARIRKLTGKYPEWRI